MACIFALAAGAAECGASPLTTYSDTATCLSRDERDQVFDALYEPDRHAVSSVGAMFTSTHLG